MKQMKKVLAMILCFAMCLSMFPTWAFAEEEASEAATEAVAAAAEPAANQEPVQEEPAAEEPEPAFICPHCGKSYKTESALKGHITRSHSGEQ